MLKLSEMLQETSSNDLRQFGPYKLLKEVLLKHDLMFVYLPALIFLSSCSIGLIRPALIIVPLCLLLLFLIFTPGDERWVPKADIQMIGFYFPPDLLDALYQKIAGHDAIKMIHLRHLKRYMEYEYCRYLDQQKREEQTADVVKMNKKFSK